MIGGIEGRDVRCPSGAANAATDGETLGGRPDALESENAVVKTTVPFHAAIMRSGEFREGKYDTGFVERMMNSEAFELKPPPGRLHE